MSEATVKYATEQTEVILTPTIIRDQLTQNPKVTNAEAYLFMKLCQAQKLNPFLREAYLIKYGDKPATIVVGKETFTKRAERHPSFDGYKAGIYIMDEASQIEKRPGGFYVSGETVVGGWAEVFRKDMKHSFEASVKMSEYEGHKSDGTLNKSWAERPATMIRKVALVQALREAFPDQFAGMYIQEEPQELEKIEAELKTPQPVEKNIEESARQTENSGIGAQKAEIVEPEEVEGTVEDAPESVTNNRQSEPEPVTENGQLELDGEPDYFKAVVKFVNTNIKETSKILPIMSKANKAKTDGDMAALKALYEELTGGENAETE